MVRKLFILLLSFSIAFMQAMDSSWLKGTMTPFAEQGKHAASPVTGAAFLESGDAVKIYEEESEAGSLMKKMGHVLDGKLRLTQQDNHPMAHPTPALLGELNKAVLANTVKDYLTEETLGKWFDNYKREHKGSNKYKKRSKFKKTFEDIINLIQKVNKDDAAKTISSFAYLISRNGDDLVDYAQELGVKVVPQKFKEAELETITDNIDQAIAMLVKRGLDENNFLHIEDLYCGFRGEKGASICVETALWTVINFILYNHVTKEMDLNLLPSGIKVINGLKEFIDKYPNPQISGYTELAKQDWMNLVSGVEGVMYRQQKDKDPNQYYVIASRIDNSLFMLNYLFGTKSQSFTDFGKDVSTKKRTISMVQERSFSTDLIRVTIGNEYKSVLKWGIETYHSSVSLGNSKNNERISEEDFNIVERLKRKHPYISLDSLAASFLATLYIAAIRSNNLNLVRRLLSANIDINAISNVGVAPLHEAASENNMEIVKFLLDNGAVLDLCNEGKITPLRYALDFGQNLDMAKFLLNQGADKNVFDFPNIETGETSLHIAIQNNNLEVVQFLIEQGINVNVMSKNYVLPLQYAIEKNCDDIVRLLLDHGADVKAVDGKGETALAVAIRKNKSNIEQLLRDSEAE